MLLEQKGDAIDVGGDGIVLVFHHRRQIEFRLAYDDAERRELMIGLGEFLRGVKQRFGGNAADVEAGSAMRLRLAFFDDGDFHAELRGADGADIAAGPGPDDDEIVS